ncbi:MAG: trigger factor, partial [Pseudomonadota bacterium]|nr:trigger factor [Pseudomonadota bacterium]
RLAPQVKMPGFRPGKDAEVTVRLEALPEVPTPDIDGLELERLTVEPGEAAVDDQLQRLVEANKSWSDAPGGRSAQQGDLVVVDFEGRVNGELFEGGKGEDMSVELGSGRLIPGFEDQLIGAGAGDSREVKVTFPKDYPTDSLKGKAAVFDVTVKAVRVAGEAKADDDFAKSLGLKDLDQLRGLLRDQLSQDLKGLTRTHMKRRLLDQLAERSDFAVPGSMVEAEYQSIMQQLRHEAGHEGDPQAALAEVERDSDEYRTIAERRVRLGLVLSEVGGANGIEVTQPEMNQLIAQAASQYQPKDRDRFIQYVQQEPTAAAQLRAPLYEDKVVDFLFSKAKITDRSASREELEADLESEEGHVHGPGCGHDHAPAAKPKSKAKAKKADVKAVEADARPAPKKVKLTPEADAKPEPAKPLKNEPANKAAAAKANKAAAKPAAKKPAKNAK